jgi:hypothetical protein
MARVGVISGEGTRHHGRAWATDVLALRTAGMDGACRVCGEPVRKGEQVWSWTWECNPLKGVQHPNGVAHKMCGFYTLDDTDAVARLRAVLGLPRGAIASTMRSAMRAAHELYLVKATRVVDDKPERLDQSEIATTTEWRLSPCGMALARWIRGAR